MNKIRVIKVGDKLQKPILLNSFSGNIIIGLIGIISIAIINGRMQERDQTDMMIFLIAIAAIVIAIVAFALLSMNLCKRIALGISDPLHKMAKIADSISKGNIDVDIQVDSEDETGAVMESFKKIIEALQRMKTDVNMLVSGAVEGSLDKHANASLHEGAYREIVEGINAILDTVKAALGVSSNFISRLANGEHQEGIKNTFKGDFATFINNLNEISKSVNTLDEESTKLANASRDGDLTVRGDVSKLKGIFAQIIIGVNNIFDSNVVPLGESRIILGKMAVNDYTSKMSDGYNGLFKEFAESINNVLEHLLNIEKTMMEVSRGCLDSLDSLKKIGKRSENDKMVPSIISMMQSIQNMTKEADRLALATIDGDLSIRGDESKFEGGYREIIQGMNRTMEAVAAPIEESSKVLQKFASGNLTVEMVGEYKGEYNQIKTALNQAVRSFNEILTDINVAAYQVAVGSEQVANASQSLSQGATEQASSVEQLTSSIAQIAAQTKENAVNSSKASTLSLDVKAEADKGNIQMGQMLNSMSEINESSSKISKIIKVIDDIAFQTNILALNAAVEAARAGQSGKGFAVVAEEVRTLAAKSAEAAKNTTVLIEGSINKVEAGTKIANETAQKLNAIAESVQKSASLVSSIATASNEQATALAQIDKGVMQVSTVVQTNSATAEQSAAASEELSGQANMLTQMVSKFKLKSSQETFGDNLYKTVPPEGVKAAPRTPVKIKLPPSTGFGKY